jgi:replicative DNA helicase
MISFLMEHEQGSPDLKKARRQKANLKEQDRLPPHSPEAERGVLGCILLSPVDCIGLCIERLKDGGDVFYDLRHKIVYDVLLDMQQQGVPIDNVTLVQELKDWLKLEDAGGLQYVATLPDAVPSAANLEHYIEIVLEKYVLRKGIVFFTEASSRAFDHQGEVDQLVDEWEHDVRTITEIKQNTSTLLPASAIVPAAINWMEQAFNNQGQLSGIGTGFPDLDKMTGGLQLGEMIIIAARPSTGKSALCMNIADHVAVTLHIPTVVFSLEMTAMSLITRTICSRARVSISHVRDGDLVAGDFGKLTTASAAIHHAPLFIDEASSITVRQLCAKARRIKQQHGIRLVVIDYLQLLRGGQKTESRQQEVSEISREIKTMAKELKVPVLVACQLNREVEKDKKKRKPRMSDIRESGSIENDADVIGFLHKPSKEEKEGEEQEEDHSDAGPIDLVIAKQRNGRTGDIRLTFLRSFTRFESAAPVSAPQQPNEHYADT